MTPADAAGAADGYVATASDAIDEYVTERGPDLLALAAASALTSIAFSLRAAAAGAR